MKNTDKILEYREYSYTEIRFPKLDALSIFIPTGQESDKTAQDMTDKIGYCRWYPVEGGYNVLFPFQDQSYDETRFKIEKDGWSHEHCKICNTSISAMTSCWATKKEPYVLVCETCYKKQINLKNKPPKITRLGVISLIAFIIIGFLIENSHMRRMDPQNWKSFMIDAPMPEFLNMTRKKIYKVISFTKYNDEHVVKKDSGYSDYFAGARIKDNFRNVYVFKFMNDKNIVEEIALDLEDPDIAYFEK